MRSAFWGTSCCCALFSKIGIPQHLTIYGTRMATALSPILDPQVTTLSHHYQSSLCCPEPHPLGPKSHFERHYQGHPISALSPAPGVPDCGSIPSFLGMGCHCCKPYSYPRSQPTNIANGVAATLRSVPHSNSKL